MKKALILASILYFAFLCTAYAVYAQDVEAIKAEIHRHREAIQRLRAQLIEMGVPPPAEGGYSEGVDEYYGGEDYGDAGYSEGAPLPPPGEAGPPPPPGKVGPPPPPGERPLGPKAREALKEKRALSDGEGPRPGKGPKHPGEDLGKPGKGPKLPGEKPGKGLGPAKDRDKGPAKGAGLKKDAGKGPGAGAKQGGVKAGGQKRR